MKNPTIILGVIIILVVVVFGIFTLSQKSATDTSSMMQQDEVMMKDESKSMEKTGDAMMDKNTSSRYVEYSKEVLDSAANNRRVLYFFANWCPTCRPADANFKENTSKVPEDVTVIRVNYNDTETDQEEKDLAKKYGITYQHTFVQIDSNGNEVTKWNGGQINELLANLK